ncbi:MAG: molybdate ABC transporter substrate-binding protein, partial [Thermodesulfatator sp.]
QGQVVLWTKRKDLCAETTWQKVIKREDLPKIAIANPETAPYGEVAAKALKKTGLWKFVEPRLVYAQTVSQAFQYAEIGGVDLSFTALSYALSDEGKRGCYWPIPEAPSVVQEACILKRTPQKAAASKFLKFLTSNKVKPVLEKYGYR